MSEDCKRLSLVLYGVERCRESLSDYDYRRISNTLRLENPNDWMKPFAAQPLATLEPGSQVEGDAIGNRKLANPPLAKLWTEDEWAGFSAEERHRLNLAYFAGLAAKEEAQNGK